MFYVFKIFAIIYIYIMASPKQTNNDHIGLLQFSYSAIQMPKYTCEWYLLHLFNINHYEKMILTKQPRCKINFL